MKFFLQNDWAVAIRRCGRVFGATVTLTFSCILFCVSLTTALTAVADMPVEIEARDSFIAAPPFSVFEDRNPEGVRLLGMELGQGGAILHASDTKLVIQPEESLGVSLFWIAKQPITSSIPVLFQFASRDGVVNRSIGSEIGPDAGETWETGGVYMHRENIDMQLVAGRFSGDAFLSIFIGSEEAPTDMRSIQQTLEFILLPLKSSRRVNAGRYAEFFGEHYRSLNASFRLGRGVRQRLTLEDATPTTYLGIGLVSAYGYNSIPQGAEVGRCIMYAGSDVVAELPIISGVNTARTDYDFDPASREHQKITIMESEEADYLDANGAPFQRHKYVATLPLPSPVAFDALAFEMTARGTLDIFDVVLMK